MASFPVVAVTELGVVSRTRRVHPSAGVLTLTVLGVIGVMACGSSGDSGDTEAFCRAIEDNQQTLTSPTIATGDDIDTVVDLYSDVGDDAPLAIEEEWDALADLYETASTLEPNDREGRQEVNAKSFATEGAAVRVRQWVRENCDVDLGPVATIVDHDPQLPRSSTPPETSPNG